EEEVSTRPTSSTGPGSGPSPGPSSLEQEKISMEPKSAKVANLKNEVKGFIVVVFIGLFFVFKFMIYFHVEFSIADLGFMPGCGISHGRKGPDYRIALQGAYGDLARSIVPQ